MLLYFPKEIKEKRKENEREQASINKEQCAKYILPPRRLAYNASAVTRSTSTALPRDSNCNIM